jgi:hypothetical protein
MSDVFNKAVKDIYNACFEGTELGDYDLSAKVRSIIQYTKKTLPGYFESCIKQRLADGLGSTTDFRSVDALENALLTASYVPFEDNGALIPGCYAVKTYDIPGHLGIVPVDSLPDEAVLTLRDPKNTGFLSACTATQQRTDVDFTVLIIGKEDDGDNEVMYTFHPGAPVPPPSLKAGVPNEVTGKEYHDGDQITVAEAKSLGIMDVKAE